MTSSARAPSSLAAAGDANPPLIALRNVQKTYLLGEQSVRALDNISFEICEHEFVAIVGPSGSGKSTVMNLLGALDVPTAGSLQIGGQDTTTLSSDALADLRNRTIGFVFQQFNLLPRTTALRQVMLPLTYSRPRHHHPEQAARMRLEQVGLDHRLNHYPRQLSGGQQQRVAIARALVNNPKLLLADEPTGALDTRTAEQIMRLFCTLNQQGVTIVLVTHDSDVAKHARRQLVFRDGMVVKDVRDPTPDPARSHVAALS